MIFMKTIRLTFAALLLATFPVLAGEMIAPKDLPKEVTEAIEKRYTGAKVLFVEKDTDDGKVVFEVKIEHENRKRDLDVTPGGEIVKDELDD